MSLQNKFYYQNNFSPNPSNVSQAIPPYGDYRTAFNGLPEIKYNGKTPKSIFDNNNFQNTGTLHNNLHNILLNEEIQEYSVLIDSKDRNYQVFPDPFHYEVTFGPKPRSREVVNGEVITHQDPNPVINDKFINARYIKLEQVVLPFFYKIICKEEPDVDSAREGATIETCKINISKTLPDELYTVMTIQEYNDTNYKSTNDVLSDSFATIYYDTRINDTHYRGITSNGVNIFRQDQLGEINKFKIDFYDPYGNPLTVDHLDKTIMSNMECNCDNPHGDSDTDCFRHNLFHPLNPIFQHHLHFKVGVIEPRLHKVTFN
jgi:hypothetical protein